MSTIDIRPVTELDVAAIEAIDERISGRYQPEHWERQVAYYLTRDPQSALVACSGGQVIGFMFGDIRGWEFGLAQPTGWIEVIGVDHEHRRGGVARQLATALLAHWRQRQVRLARTLVAQNDADLAAFFTQLGMTPSAMTAFECSLV
jgi:ribosomal protein S18 acetylase RimI-like enzyme